MNCKFLQQKLAGTYNSVHCSFIYTMNYCFAFDMTGRPGVAAWQCESQRYK